MEIFVRQRRNLILVSFVLLISLIFHIQLSKFNVLGNEFLITKQQPASTLLWPLWVYWLVRYFQVFIEVGWPNFSQAFVNRFKISLGRFATKLFKPTPEITKKVKEVLKDVHERARLNLVFTDTFDGKYYFSVAAGTENVANGGVGATSMEFNGFIIFWIRFKGGLYVALFTTAFTEYMFPFLIASAPVLCLRYCQ